MGADYLDRLRELAVSDPGQTVQAIVRLQEPPQTLEDELAARGIRVRRVFHLLPAIAVEASAEALLGLSEEPWVRVLEEDKEVAAGRDA